MKGVNEVKGETGIGENIEGSKGDNGNKAIQLMDIGRLR